MCGGYVCENEVARVRKGAMLHRGAAVRRSLGGGRIWPTGDTKRHTHTRHADAKKPTNKHRKPRVSGASAQCGER